MKMVLIILLVLLGGCSAIPAKDFLGITGKEDVPERPIEAVSMQFPGQVSDVDGYKIPIPPEWQERDVVCRTFENFEGKDAEVCRKTSRVFVDGAKCSAFIADGYWYVFLPRGRNFSILVFPAAKGGTSENNKPFIVRKEVVHKLDSKEIREVYNHVADTFPYQSKPIEDSGVSLLFGQDALEVLSVPALTTAKERMAYCGLASVSSTEIIGLMHANPMAAIPKAWAAICSVLTEPNLLVKEETSRKVQSDEGIAFTGDR
ncbi:MAG: hypothetical protein IPJ67_01695 [Candidatus Moraniibacteriota bacterium]|nr:MAG: hypothetical protein IPJ67_01695 [Candidatus Moranbacteria bacterium]